MYLEFDEYQELGGTLDLSSFIRYGFAVEKLIDNATFLRIKNEKPVREAVKMLFRELVDFESKVTISSSANEKQREISSMSNDGISVSYSSTNDESMSEDQKKEFKRKMIRDYLISELDDNGRSIIYAGSD